MKYSHDIHKDKVFYVAGTPYMGYTVRQYIKGVPGSKLQLSATEVKKFEQRLKESGWYAIEK
jgi:hypothetical protein